MQITFGSLGRDPSFLIFKKEKKNREFPDCPIVRILYLHCLGPGLIPVHGTNIPQAMWQGPKKERKKKRYIMRATLILK